jgi:hypothetical protein
MALSTSRKSEETKVMATLERDDGRARVAALRSATAVALWTARGAALVLLALGVYIWAGGSDQLITVHVVVGVLLVLSLWTIAAIAAASGVSAVVIGFAVVWSFVAVLLGMSQEGLVTGDWHWTIQALHLVIAMAMVGWCQVLVVLMRRAGSTRASRI